MLHVVLILLQPTNMRQLTRHHSGGQRPQKSLWTYNGPQKSGLLHKFRSSPGNISDVGRGSPAPQTPPPPPPPAPWPGSATLWHGLSTPAAQFAEFFADPGTFALGVCNGCQMMSNIKELIPGAQDWPHFVRNKCEQFEARVALVGVAASDSVFLKGMAGSRLPIAVAHGEGRAEFAAPGLAQAALDGGLVALQYVMADGAPAARYPHNPNGSAHGIAGLTTPDGRVTIMMPHPERCTRSVCNSWKPDDWMDDAGPWLSMFANARRWVG